MQKELLKERGLHAFEEAAKAAPGGDAAMGCRTSLRKAEGLLREASPDTMEAATKLAGHADRWGRGP